jgi:hypothetical protein
LSPVLQIWDATAETLFDNLIYSQTSKFGGRILSAASPSLEDVFEQCCNMDASLAERLATFAEAVRTQRPAFGDAVERTTILGISRAMIARRQWFRDVPKVLKANRSKTMKKQIVTIMLGAAVMLGTATSLFAQNGNAIGGGAAGGPNGAVRLQRQQHVQCDSTAKAALNISARRKVDD